MQFPYMSNINTICIHPYQHQLAVKYCNGRINKIFNETYFSKPTRHKKGVFYRYFSTIMFFSATVIWSTLPKSLPLCMQSCHPLGCSVRDGILKAAVSLIDSLLTMAVIIQCDYCLKSWYNTWTVHHHLRHAEAQVLFYSTCIFTEDNYIIL